MSAWDWAAVVGLIGAAFCLGRSMAYGKLAAEWRRILAERTAIRDEWARLAEMSGASNALRRP